MPHSPFGPSALQRRALCPASYRAEKDLPEIESEQAGEGSKLHDLVAAYICGKERQPLLDAAGESAESVNACFGFIDLLKSQNPTANFLPEKYLQITDEIFGTADLVVVEPFQHAVVVDWKFGFNDPEPADENLQLGAYALGVHIECECETIDVAVIMAAKGKVSQHQYTADDWPKIAKRINEIVAHCKSPFAPFLPTTDGCRYCRAASHCPALLEIANMLPISQEPGQLPPSEIGRLLLLAKKLDPWMKCLEQKAYQIALAGGTVPGFKLVDGRPSRIWGPDVDEKRLAEVAVLLEKPEESIYTTELASPAQLEKKWGKAKKVVEVIKPLIFTKLGAPRLVAGE
jgi:hypothetical protein